MTSNGTSAPAPPQIDLTSVRQVHGPAADALADFASVFDEMQWVLRCCEHLVTGLTAESGPVDEVLLEALWTSALQAYARSFVDGPHGPRLTVADVAAAEVGDVDDPKAVQAWHETLGQLAGHHADPVKNPRELFSVGFAQDESGAPTGVAVTSASLPRVDEATVRRTGALAFGLSQLIDRRIGEQQRMVVAGLGNLSASDLDHFDTVDLSDDAGEPGKD
ncbi:MAG: hypothetical protein Q7T56_02775 [Nocardioidaceae bacterium]|nr:hypothetical protein [Nocardioidaceae bacterium]